MQDLRFLYFILYLCTASNFFFVGSSAMGAHSRTNKEGIIFDVIYGLGCALNLLSDLFMLRALRNPSEAKAKFRLFLIWNTLTTCAYYVTDLFLSGFNSKHAKLEKEHLQDMDEESARSTIFYVSILISTVVFLVKGGILYAFYHMYQNYDQVVANEEARARGNQQGFPANARPAVGYVFQPGNPVGVPAVVAGADARPAVGYVFQPGNPVGVPAVVAGPALLPAASTGGSEMSTPSWSDFPNTTPGLSEVPQAVGKPYYITIQQPCPPGQLRAGPSTQPQSFPPEGIPYEPYHFGVQPELARDLPAVSSRRTAEAMTAVDASAESHSNKPTPDAPPTRASTNPDARTETNLDKARLTEDKTHEVTGSRPSATTRASRTLFSVARDTQAEAATGEATSSESVYVSTATAKPGGHKLHGTLSKLDKSPKPRPQTDTPGSGRADA